MIEREAFYQLLQKNYLSRIRDRGRPNAASDLDRGSLSNRSCFSQRDSHETGMPQLSDEYLMPFTEEFRHEIERTMAFGWLIDENKLCQMALTSDGKYQGLVKWTKEYEDDQRKSNRWSDEDILSEKTVDLHEAIYRKVLQIKREYTRPGSLLSDLSFCRVWIGGEDRKPKKHFCWTFTPFGPNSIQRSLQNTRLVRHCVRETVTSLIQRAVVSDDAARGAALAQFRRDAGVDPSERANFWFRMNVFPYGNVEVETVDEECRKVLKPSLFLDPGHGLDGAGADQAAESGPTFAQIIPYDR